MTSPIVHDSAPVILVGAGQLYQGDLTDSLTVSKRIVAADGGADAVLAAGLVPEVVIGDMDSAQLDARLEGRVHHIAEQNSTDFEKALRSIEAPLILALGFTGGRTDHELAVMTGLVRHAHRRVIVVGRESIVFVCPRVLEMDLPVGSVFSLFPMGDVAATSEGLLYPLDGLAFRPDGQIGTSNAVTGPVCVGVDGPKMLVILPRGALGAVIEVLAHAERWSAL